MGVKMMPQITTRAICRAICAATLAVAPLMGKWVSAEIVTAVANGFEIHETAHTSASPDKVYAALLLPAQWWNPDHTFSGNAANLSLDARAGGCWCETLPDGGSVEHLRVVYVSPGKFLRLRGALGPFQGLAVDGVMTWSVKSVVDGTDISFTYVVGGYAKDGLAGMAGMTDKVLGGQVERLKKFVEGESPPKGH
jgi:uncharacterized protein YndB with AHSA1/START domain